MKTKLPDNQGLCCLFLSGFRPGRLLIVIAILFLTSDLFSQSCNYAYRKRIRIDYGKVAGGANLANYPLLINIAADPNLVWVGSAATGHIQSANGWDTYFTAADGVTPLDQQIESYAQATGAFITWVRVPVVYFSAYTYIYMYYGGSAAAPNPSVNTVWDANYKAVFHLTGGSLADATATLPSNNGTNSGSTTNAATIIGSGISFPAASTTKYAQMGLNGCNGGSGNGSVELWAYSTAFTASTYYFGQTTLPAYADRIQIYIGATSGANGILYLGMGSNHNLNTNVATINPNKWYHIVLTWATTGAGVGNYTIYVNGVSAATGVYAAFSAINTYGDLGNDGDPAQRTEQMTGSVDELRVSTTTRTAGWVTTCYNNENSPSTFYTIYPEGPRWIGTTDVNWTTATNWSPAVVPGAGADIVVSNGTHQLTNLGANRNISALWIQPSATVNMTTNKLFIDTFEVTNCGTLTATLASTGLITFDSKISQYISGSGTNTLSSLTINNTAAANQLTLLNVVTVNDALTMTLGNIYTTTADILALTTTATSTSGSASSFVSGPMSKNGTANFSFPVGKGTTWARLDLSGITLSSNFRVEYFNVSYVPVTPVAATITNVSALEYWELDQLSGLANAIVTLHWENAGNSGINNCGSLSMASWTGVTWIEQAATAAGSCAGAGAGSVTTNIAALTATFNEPFTFASKAWGVNPLPVELLNFNAVPDNDYVNVTWTTASETNNSLFTVERTADGIAFTSVGTKPGAGTSSSQHNYQLYDHAPLPNTSYYRLKQTDMNGHSTTFNLVPVTFGGSNLFNLIVFPNPADRGEAAVSLTAPENTQVLVVVFDAEGRETYSKVIITSSSGPNLIALDTENRLSPGLYIVSASSDNSIVKKKLIVK
jgi:hypothetical protein